MKTIARTGFVLSALLFACSTPLFAQSSDSATSLSNAPYVGQGTPTATATPPLSVSTPNSNSSFGSGSAEAKGGKHGERLKKLVQALGITPERKSEFEPIVKQSRAEIQQVAHNKSLSKEEKRAQIKEIARSTKKEIYGMLTPEQQQKFREIMQKYKSQHGGGQATQ